MHESFDQPSKPVITSLTGANKQFKLWLEENNYKKINDGDNTPWIVRVHVDERPNTANGEWQWHVKIEVISRVKVQNLIDGGVLKESEDQRMIQLLGSEIIPLRMKNIEFISHSEEEARMAIMDASKNISRRLHETPLTELKRKWVGDFLNRKLMF